VNAFEAFIDELATRVAEKIASRDNGRINQRHPQSLGRRRHPEAVKRRIRDKLGGAYHIGRDYELTPEALREELEWYGPRGSETGDDDESAGAAVLRTPRPSPRRKKAAAPANAEAAALLAELDRELAEAGEVRVNAPARKPRK
jgi:hypothetical protein